MKTPARVVWSEGMLMSPQHFQQQERYFEALLEQRVAGLVPHGWGALELELDERALDAGQVALRRFAGVLPSGTVLRFSQGEPEAPTSRPLGGHLAPQQQVLEVFVGLPSERAGRASYARSELERSQCRYVIEAERMVDAVSPESEDSIDCAFRNVQLLFGDEPRENVECMKIAEVVRDGSGKLAFSSSYVVPALRVGVSPALREGFRRILALATARRRAVASERRHRDAQAAEFGSDDVTRYLALAALSGAIPLLAHLAEGEIAPQQAYLTLLQLAGQLTAFSLDDDPSQLPSYVHTDLRQTFEALLAKITGMLRIAVATRVVSIALEARADRMHLGRIPDPELLKTGVRYVLSVQSPLPEHHVYEQLLKLVKVASWSEMPQLVNAAVSGVPLTPARRPPREIVMRPGRCYFMVAVEHASWAQIAKERAIAVFLPEFDAKSTVLELLAIPSE